jgi:hypothetical protein
MCADNTFFFDGFRSQFHFGKKKKLDIVGILLIFADYFLIKIA